MNRYIPLLVALVLAGAPKGAQAREGLQLSIQGEVGVSQGFQNFDTDQGLTLGALVGIHPAGPLSLEVEYQHSWNDVRGFGSSATLDTDGVLGHVRIDFFRGHFLPFVYGGVGWVHLSVDNLLSVSGLSLKVKDDSVVLPVGAGLEIGLYPIVIGARAEYQWVANDIVNENVDFWKVVGTIGFRSGR